MIKKVYSITGFDCGHCASRTEKFLNSLDFIVSARLDFAQNKLYISYKNKEKSINELKKLIKKVETNTLEIKELDIGVKNSTPIFTTKMLINSIRIVVSIVLIVIAEIAFGHNNFWMLFTFYAIASLIAIYDIVWKVINRVIHLKNPFDESLLLSIAVFGSMAISLIYKFTPDMAHKAGHYLMDGAMVILLYQIGKIIEGIAINKSKNAIMSAIDLRVEVAHLISGTQIKDVTPAELKVGDEIIVKVGEMIPIDGLVIGGEALIDKSSLTGEPVPDLANENSLVLSGCIVKEGSIIIQVQRPYSESTISKILNLISSSEERKSKADQFITKFAKWYTPSVLIFAILFASIFGLATQDWLTYIFKGLEFLVVACPCAIVISVPLAYFSGIGLASKNGILIKGSNYLDELASLKNLVLDKTGTITEGVFKIDEIHTNNLGNGDFLDLIYAAESLSNHPIGKAITHGINKDKYLNDIVDFKEVIGLGVTLIYKSKPLVVGSIKLINKHTKEDVVLDTNKTVIHVLYDDKYQGYVTLSDTLKETSKETINLLNASNVSTTLLTGDKYDVAKDMCETLNIPNFKAELLPNEKVNELEIIMKEKKGVTAFVGDGINDAASIKFADVGIAMGGIGSDVAVENADIVLMNDEPMKIYEAYTIAKMTRNTALFNIIFSLTIKFSIIVLTAIFPVDMIIPVLADTGLTVLMVLNSLFLLYRKTKRKN